MLDTPFLLRHRRALHVLSQHSRGLLDMSRRVNAVLVVMEKTWMEGVKPLRSIFEALQELLRKYGRSNANAILLA